jgi:hypothetical protein
MFRSGIAFLQIFVFVLTAGVCFQLVPRAYSQSSVRQGTTADLHRHSSPNIFVSPMVISQTLKDFCAGEPIGKEEVWKSYSYGHLICEDVSLRQVDFGLMKKERWLTPKLTVWVSVYTRKSHDRIVDLKFDFYSGNKWVHGLVIRNIDAEEKKETTAEKKIDCPAELFYCKDEPGVIITISVKDNG